ncbi:MAG: hypothetical protein ACK6AD_04245 [Cyanobacteriota bacterium]
MNERISRRAWWLDQATWLLVVAVMVALALNGLPFWARRVGLLDRAAYARDLALFCAKPPPAWWLPATCRPHRLITSGAPPRLERIPVDRLYHLSPLDLGLKLSRQAVLPLLLLASAGLSLVGWSDSPALPTLAPLAPLLLSSLCSAWISLPLDGGLATMAAGAASLWLPLAALAAWLTTPRRLRILADGAAALVLLQLPFLALEAMRGLPMPFGGPASPWLPSRLSALMNQPNSLGGLLAVSVALCLAVSHRPWQRWPLLLLALAMALLARSGAGVGALVLLVAWMGFGQRPRRGRLLCLAGALAALTLVLPQVLGRPQLYGSPMGRVELLRQWWTRPQSPLERWLGHGLASQSDPRRIMALQSPPGEPAAGIAPAGQRQGRRHRGPVGEGQPLLLLAQGGVVALVAFYGLLGWCAWRDPPLRLFWGVLLLISLTLNVTEVFPLGIWLAVATRRALSGGWTPANGGRRDRDDGSVQPGPDSSGQ